MFGIQFANEKMGKKLSLVRKEKSSYAHWLKFLIELLFAVLIGKFHMVERSNEDASVRKGQLENLIGKLLGIYGKNGSRNSNGFFAGALLGDLHRKLPKKIEIIIRVKLPNRRSIWIEND